MRYLSWFKWLFIWLLPSCSYCQEGRLHYAGEDYTGHTWISVYECDNCKGRFI